MTWALASSSGMFEGKREDPLARGHDFADGNIVELDGAVDERLLKAGEQAQAAGGGSDELEFFRRVDGGPLGHGNVETAQNDGGRSFQ